MKYGDLSLQEGDFYGASLYYKEALNYDSSKLDILNKYCEALRGFNNYKQAEKYYARLVQKDQTNQFPQALFWLAEMQKSNGKYDAAESNFSLFVDKYPNHKDFLWKKAQQEKIACVFAKSILANPKKVSIENAGSAINSGTADFAAFTASQDSILWFSSIRGTNTQTKDSTAAAIKIYKSTKVARSWNPPLKEDSLLNNVALDVANGSFSSDGKTFYFSGCNAKGCRIYTCRYLKEQWTSPQPLPAPVNIPGFTSTQPFVASVKGNEVLLFASDRPGTLGQMDLWFAVRKGKNEFSEPVNLGATINTPDNELCPFYDADSTYLYFSSAWHSGLGGYDIFKSSGDLRHQLEPVNLGYPINSSANDLYFFLTRDRSTAYFSSNRIGSIAGRAETCCNDIWIMHYLPLEKEEEAAVVKGIDSLKVLLPLSLYFHNDYPNPNSWDTLTSQTYTETYKHYITLKEVYKKEYASILKESVKQQAAKEAELFFLDKVEKNYEKLHAFEALLLSELKKGSRLDIGIRGFASPLSSARYNTNLSKRRISSFINELHAYSGGILNDYIEKGYLIISELPFGESKSNPGVSDNRSDARLSVFSPAAAAERRIELVYVIQQDKKD